MDTGIPTSMGDPVDSPPLTSIQPPSSALPRKKPRRRVKLLGYAVTRSWLVDYGSRHNIATEGNPEDTAFNAIRRIKREARLQHVTAIKSEESDSGLAFCFSIANNKSHEGLRGATKERIEKLMKALDQTEPPKWL